MKNLQANPKVLLIQIVASFNDGVISFFPVVVMVFI
jgi:hypothetical protein